MNPFAVICLLYINITTGHKLRKNRTFPRRSQEDHNSGEIKNILREKTQKFWYTKKYYGILLRRKNSYNESSF